MLNAEKLYTTLCGIFCLYNNFFSLGRYIWCCEIKWPLIIHHVPYDAFCLSQSMLKIGLGWGFDNISHIWRYKMKLFDKIKGAFDPKDDYAEDEFQIALKL